MFIKKFRIKFPIFNQSASMTSKMTAIKIYLFIFNLENVVENLSDILKPVTLVEITFFIIVERY